MSQPPASAPERLQHGALGVSSIVFFVVAAAAPLTVMAGIAPLAIMIGGIGAPAGYLIAGLILTVFAVAFTAMSKYIHNAGAFYSYIARGLGKPAGLGAAALAVYSYNAIQIGLYGAFGYFAAMTAKDLTGLDLPWWAWAAAGIAVVWFFGYRSIHGGAKILGGLLIAETGILALLAAAILVKGGAHGLSLASFAPAHVVTGGTGSVLTLAFGAFIGFEATAIYREEARTPDRTVPRATYVAVGFLGLFYAFISWVIIQAFGNTGAVHAATTNPASMFFTAMTTYVGGWATDLMRVLIVTSLFAALLAFHNAITRYTYALASEGALPRRLGRIHPVHKSPYIAGYAQTALAALVVAGFAAVPRRPLPPATAVGEHPRRHRNRDPAGADSVRGVALLPPHRPHRVRRPHAGGPAGRGNPAHRRRRADHLEDQPAHRSRPRRQLDPDRLSPRRVRARRRIRRPDAPPPPRGVRAAGHHRRRRRGPRRRQPEPAAQRQPGPAAQRQPRLTPCAQPVPEGNEPSGPGSGPAAPRNPVLEPNAAVENQPTCAPITAALRASARRDAGYERCGHVTLYLASGRPGIGRYLGP